jgi:hypothetical protein
MLEEDETLTLELTRPAGAVLADSLALGTILDDDLCPGPELVRNGGGEERTAAGDPVGWARQGPAWRRLHTSAPVPYSGRAVLAGLVNGELLQDVPLDAYAHRIDLGIQLFTFSARLRTVGDASVRARLEYLGRDGSLLDAHDSDRITSPDAWLQIEDKRLAPSGTRAARIRLLAEDITAEDEAVLADALSLRSLVTATVSSPPTVVDEGDEEEWIAHVPVELSCPFWRPVSVEHATADGSALAGKDYAPENGSTELPAGTVSAEIPVRVIGDRIDERHETVALQLGALAPADDAVLLHTSTTLTVRNDDWCSKRASWWSRRRPHVFPQPWLEVGGEELEWKELKAILAYAGKDAASGLAREAATAELNLLRGAEAAVAPFLERADALLTAHPPGSGPLGKARRQALRLTADLQGSTRAGAGDERTAADRTHAPRPARLRSGGRRAGEGSGQRAATYLASRRPRLGDRGRTGRLRGGRSRTRRIARSRRLRRPPPAVGRGRDRPCPARSPRELLRASAGRASPPAPPLRGGARQARAGSGGDRAAAAVGGRTRLRGSPRGPHDAGGRIPRRLASRTA